MRKLVLGVAVIVVVAGLLVVIFGVPLQDKAERDLNAVAVYLYSSEVEAWLANPKKAFVEAYFSFPPSLAEDVAFGVDIEFWDGEETYLYLPSGIWMAYVFITRGGTLVFHSGNDENFAGDPAKADLTVIQTSVVLRPNVWYKLRCEADFGKRRLVSFKVEGDGISKTFDLSSYSVVLPEFASVSQRILFVSVGAYKLLNANGTNIVYVDDVKVAIENNGKFQTVFSDGFETQATILDVPKTFTVKEWTEKVWHKERNTAKVSIVTTPVHKGLHSLRVDCSI